MTLLNTSGQPRYTARICLVAAAGGIMLAGLFAPVAAAAPDCSPAGVDAASEKVMQQAQAYLNAHPAGNKMLMTAALQPRQEAAATISAYATDNPQEYAEFKAILAPLGTLQSQCGAAVVPAQFQWAFDQFIGG